MSIQSNLSGILSRSGEGLHTAFTAKVLASDGATATVQPLYSPSGVPAVPLEGVPIPQSVREAETVTEATAVLRTGRSSRHLRRAISCSAYAQSMCSVTHGAAAACRAWEICITRWATR